MSATIHTLPVWKKGASVAERFEELAHYARQHPERFEKVVIAYLWRPDGEGNGFRVRWSRSENLSTEETIGLLQMAQLSMWQDTLRTEDE